MFKVNNKNNRTTSAFLIYLLKTSDKLYQNDVSIAYLYSLKISDNHYFTPFSSVSIDFE